MRSIWLLFLSEAADLKARNEYEKRDVRRKKLWLRRVFFADLWFRCL